MTCWNSWMRWSLVSLIAAAAAAALLAAGCGTEQNTAKEAAPVRAAESPAGSTATTDGGHGKKPAVPAELHGPAGGGPAGCALRPG
ncbi:MULTISPECIES: hypothetical protein [Streptomyces]|uniref:hypothetical protein n=1 Tax=Streptomyces TaxID=1883 RepID=UPI00142DDBB6|nr:MULTISPECIES: hypothetical protein [Streptomyces]